MKKSLHVLGLTLLMFMVGGSVKIWGEIIVFKWTADANVEKSISLLTSAEATIEVCWDYSEAKDANNSYTATSSPLKHTYSDSKEYMVLISVSGNVTDLDCSGQGITTIALTYLPYLKKLNLSNNKITDPMDFSKNTALEYLDHSGNLLGQSASSSALALSDNKNLKELNLSNNGLTDDRVPSLEHNKLLEKLDLSNNQLVAPVGLAANTALTHLNLSNNQLGTGAGALELTLHTDLVELNLSNNGLDNNSMPALTNNKALETLNLSNNTALTELNVSDLAALKSLDVSGDSGLENLNIDNCTSLTSLNIDGTSALTEISYEGLADGQIKDFSSTGTALDPDVLAGFKEKVYVTTYYTISLEVGGGIVSSYVPGDLSVEESGHLFLQFSVEEANATIEDLIFQIDGEDTEFKVGEDGKSGSYILNPIEKDGTVLIALKEYSINIPEIQGLDINATAKAAYGSSYTFTVSSEKLDLSEMKVFANGEELTANELRSESFSYTIDPITESVDITIEGVNEGTTGNVAVTDYTLSVWKGAIQITTSEPQSVAIYEVTGAIKAQQTVNGEATISLAPGLYVVNVGGKVTKVVVY